MSKFISMNTLTDDCAFCLESIEDYDYATLNCGHKYHFICIQEWIGKTNKLTKLCPQCNINGEILNIQSGKKSNDILIEEQKYRKKSFEERSYITQNDIIEENIIEENTTHTPNVNNIQHQTYGQHPYHSHNDNTEDDRINYICCNIL